MNTRLLRFLVSLWGLLCVCTPLWAAPAANFRYRVTSTDASVVILRRLNVLGKNASLVRPRLIEPGALKTTSTEVRSVSPNPPDPTRLNFNLTGYSNSQAKVISNILSDKNYDRMASIWGAPAPEQIGKTVKIVGNEGISAAYAPPASDASGGGKIYFIYNSGDTLEANTYNLTRLVLLAFQGPRVPSFDFFAGRYIEPWLYGAADAAALQIVYQIGGSSPKFDPSSFGIYVLPVYDFWNRPEIGNAFIYPPSGDDLPVSNFRLGLAQAAFLKVYAQDSTFFKRFNGALYKLSSQPRQNIQASDLEALAATITPIVEGMPFRAWVREQYALDARVTTGQKLYLALAPIPSLVAGDTRSGFTGFAQAFTTAANGDDTGLVGYGSVGVEDETGREVSAFSSELRASNILNFNDSNKPGQAVFGAGFTAWQSPAPARLKVKARFNSTEATAYFPFGVAGTEKSASSYYGAVSGAEVGNLTLQVGSKTETDNVERGVWSSTMPYVSGPSVQTKITFNGQTQQRNTAWLLPGESARSVAFLFTGAGTNSSATLNAPAGTNALRMIAFPIQPFAHDEAQALNTTAAALTNKMARYRPNLAPAQRVNGALVFGLDGQRHEIYPNISQPLEVGRGYWLQTGVAGLQTVVKGAEPSRLHPFEIPLTGGWNQVGVPFLRSFGSDSVQVRYGGFAPVSISVAESRGWIGKGIWKWLPSGGYQQIDVAGGSWQPWEGYWVFASQARGVSLVFDPSAANISIAQADGWSVQISAATSKTRDTAGAFGVSRQLAAAKPPTATQNVTLAFNGDNVASKAGAGMAQAWLTKLNSSSKWQFTVDGAAKKERVTLSWSGLDSVPQGILLTLRDEKTGRDFRIAKGTKYAFTSDGQPHKFTIWNRAAVTTTNSTSKSTSSAGRS